MTRPKNTQWTVDENGWFSRSGSSRRNKQGWWETDQTEPGKLKPFREPPWASDPPPGRVVYDKDKPSRAVFTFQKKVYSVSTAQGGWVCPTCKMPANRNNRESCACCGKKKPDNAAETPKAKTVRVEKPAEVDDNDDDSMAEEAYSSAEPEPSCAAMNSEIPHLILLSGALVFPKDSQSEGRTKAKTEGDEARVIEDLEKQIFVTESFIEGMTGPSPLVDAAKKELAKFEGLLAKAKQASKQPEKERTETERLSDVEGVNELLSKKKKDYYLWRQKAVAHKVELEEGVLKTKAQFTELANLLLQEAQAFEDEGKRCATVWDKKNKEVDARLKAEIETLKAKAIKASEQVKNIPGAAEDVLPGIQQGVGAATREPSPAPTQPPRITPMADIPIIDLPDDLPLLQACAGIRQVLHQIAEQEDEVTEAYPLTWGNLNAAGLTHDNLKTLLSEAIAGATATSHEVVVPKRAAGALRRQVDRLATLWEVKHAQLALSAEAQSAAENFRKANLDEAKRLQRKRVCDRQGSAQDVTDDA